MLRPTRRHKLVIWSTVLLLWSSGVVFLVLRFWDDALFSITEPRSSFGATLMSVHAALGFVALVVFGSLTQHVAIAWTTRRKRRSGVVLVSSLVVMPLTAWFLYYAESDSLRIAAMVTHSLVGVSLVAVVALHVLGKRRDRTLSSSR